MWVSSTTHSSAVLSIPFEGMAPTASHTASYIFSCVVLNCAVVGVARRRSWITRAKPFDSIARGFVLCPNMLPYLCSRLSELFIVQLLA